MIDMYGQQQNYGAFNALADTLGAYIRSKSSSSGGAAGFGLGGAVPAKTGSITSYGNDINSAMGNDIVSKILNNQPAAQNNQWFNNYNSGQLLMPVLKGYGE